MAKFCGNCGAETKPGANFCEYCGSKLMQDELPQPQPQIRQQMVTPPPAPSDTGANDNPYRRNPNAGMNTAGGAEVPLYPWEVAAEANAYNPFPESGLSAQFFTTRGRLNRLRYFKRGFAIFGIAFLLFFVCLLLIGSNHEVMGGLAMIGIFIGAQVASICLVVRRFHDMEPAGSTDHNFTVVRMGAYVGFALAQFVWDWAWILSALMSLYLLFNPGCRGANKHGADPSVC